MKNFFTLSIIFTLFINQAYSQTTPATAIRFYGAFSTYGSPPPIGSEAPAGLGYGCSLIHSRPTFLMISPCVGGDFSFQSDANAITRIGDDSTKDTLSIVIWGPFTDTADLSSKLNNSNIAYCINGTGSTPIPGLFITLTGDLTLQSKSFYYAMLAVSDSVTIYDIAAGFSNNEGTLDSAQCSICHGISSNLAQDICVVTLDSATGKNEIIWEKNDPDVNGYIIYRQNTLSNQFNSIGFVSRNAFSTFFDSTSVPAEESYAYLIGAADSCGQVYIDNRPHNTIHLITSPGVKGEINLSWNAYTGTFTYPTYYIYRGPLSGPITIIDSIAAGLENPTYTDLNPPPGINIYQIVIHRSPACQPTMLAGTGYTEVRSNFTSVVTGVSAVAPPADVRLMPNPVHSDAMLQLGSLAGKINTVRLYSLSGICLSQFDPQKKSQIAISVSNLPAGIYTLSIVRNAITYKLKLVKI